MKRLIIAASFAFSSFSMAEGVPSLADIKTSLAADAQLPLTDSIELTVSTYAADELVDAMKAYPHVEAERAGDDQVNLRLSSVQQYSGQVLPKHFKPSFVIDFDESNTLDFVNDFSLTDGNRLRPTHIESFVSEYVDQPTYIHGFNIASVVAKQRSGDCTEHAVLTTALARALNIPARLMMGVVITEYDSQVSSVGHAWTEIWWQGQWKIIDAALYGSIGARHFYLPTLELENEGPGFAFSLMASSKLMPFEINNLRGSIIN